MVENEPNHREYIREDLEGGRFCRILGWWILQGVSRKGLKAYELFGNESYPRVMEKCLPTEEIGKTLEGIVD